MAGKKKFVPMLISFDERGLENAEKEAKEKLAVLDQGSVWVHNNLELGENKINYKRFHNNMVEHFLDLVSLVFKDVNQLGLSARKLIEAKEIPVLELLNIQTRYDKLSIGSEVTFNGNVPTVQVLKENFQTWSTSEKQNKKIVFGNQMIKAINDLTDSLNVKVYPLDIQRATSGFITFDRYRNAYGISKQHILN